ncbi:MAG: metal ABC transporter permease [bacterium]|nr:metal ABC transporter permease [bacterium]
MENAVLIQSLIVAGIIGIASGAIGAFIILRRMALVGDALSHVALPGIALALIYKIDPFWGVLVFLLGAALLIWWLEGKTKLPTEAIVGLLFTTSLAIGVMLIPDIELIESLFGAFPKLSLFEFIFILVFASASVVCVFLLTKKFLFSVASPELFQLDDPKRRVQLLLLIIFSFTVALGIKLLGALLMGALTIIPAAIAKNMVRSATGYIIASILLGGGIALSGFLIAFYYGFLPGPTIILFGVAVFLLSLVVKRRS